MGLTAQGFHNWWNLLLEIGVGGFQFQGELCGKFFSHGSLGGGNFWEQSKLEMFLPQQFGLRFLRTSLVFGGDHYTRRHNFSGQRGVAKGDFI